MFSVILLICQSFPPMIHNTFTGRASVPSVGWPQLFTVHHVSALPQASRRVRGRKGGGGRGVGVKVRREECKGGRAKGEGGGVPGSLANMKLDDVMQTSPDIWIDTSVDR